MARNKSAFIKLLIAVLRNPGINTIQATGHADSLIATTDITMSTSEVVTVVASDTDVLVLLVSQYSPEANISCFKPLQDR